MQNLLLIPIILPVIAGLFIMMGKMSEKKVKILSLAAVIAASAMVFALIACASDEEMILFRFTSSVSVGFRFDGLGKIFAGMIAVLWPFALCYAFEYMKHNDRKKSYFGFYVVTYGIVLGISLASDSLTMYVFYEMLTFITLPLITHTQTKEARKAGRLYLYYSLSGSSLVLAGIVIVTVTTGTNQFVQGGFISQGSPLLYLAYLFMFFGFGVKAAVFPLCRWLPMASAAPTPTTALLHAVAVVKSGAFAIIRATFYIFSAETLRNTWAQDIALAFIAISIVFGSAMALREKHLKRRFAYSTIANLSYILFGVLLCTEQGLEAGLLHFIFHSITKIGIFFCCGAIIETSGAQYVYELNGFGKKMPVIFTLYTISGLSLIGVPLFAGFVSKYYLVESGFSVGGIFAYMGIGTIICSAIFTAVYVTSVSFRAFARRPLLECESLYNGAKEPSKAFLAVTGVFSALAVVFGVYAQPIYEIIGNVVGGAV